MARKSKKQALAVASAPQDDMAGIESDMEYHAGRLAELGMKRSPSYRRMKTKLTKSVKASIPKSTKFGPTTKF